MESQPIGFVIGGLDHAVCRYSVIKYLWFISSFCACCQECVIWAKIQTLLDVNLTKRIILGTNRNIYFQISNFSFMWPCYRYLIKKNLYYTWSAYVTNIWLKNSVSTDIGFCYGLVHSHCCLIFQFGGVSLLYIDNYLFLVGWVSWRIGRLLGKMMMWYCHAISTSLSAAALSLVHQSPSSPWSLYSRRASSTSSSRLLGDPS